MNQGLCCGAPNSFFSMSDDEIISYARAGNSWAAEHLLSKYKCIVEGKARSYFLMGADHEDVVQEGMIGLFKAIRDFRSDKPAGFRAFAELCVTRQIITAVKSATRQKHVPLNRCVSLHYTASDGSSTGTLMDVLPDGCVVDPEKILLNSDMVKNLNSTAEEELSLLESKVLQYYMQGMSYQEMAKLLSCRTKSVDNALQRAKRKIGDKISRD